MNMNKNVFMWNKGLKFSYRKTYSLCSTIATEMKCVGLLFFVLLVKLFWNDKKPGYFDDISGEILKATDRASEVFEEQPHKDINYDDFRSKLNTTEGILIPDNLLLTLPLSAVSSDVLTEFRRLQQTLSGLSDNPSKNVSSVSTDLFALLDKRANKIGSLTEKCSSLTDIISEVFSSINDVVSGLNIGTGINDGVSNIAENLLKVVSVLDEAKNADSNITKKFNDVVFSMTTSVQVLINSISVLAEAATTKIGISAEAKEAIVSLTLILQTIVVFVQSIASSIASIALSTSNLTPTSLVLNSYLWIVNRQSPVITNVLSSITSDSLASSLSTVVSTISVALKSFSYRINQSVEKLQTSVLLPASTRLEIILNNLIGSETNFTSYITTSTATISSSMAAISSSDSGIQSKICRQLYPLIRNLIQLTGTDNEIATNFAESLPGILEILKVVSGNLNYVIGVELTSSVIKSIEDVFVALQNMANLLIQGNIDASKMDDITVECAKAVQILGSVVIAITKTISNSLGSMNDVALESVIALPILQSTVLYVAEWVTVVASSISLTKTGETHELVSSLAVTIVAILKHVSSVVEIIAVSSAEDPTQIVTLILSPVLDFEKSSASISSISKIDAKTSAKIEIVGDKRSVAFAIEGINTTDEKNLSELLNGLTEPLSTISSSFTSSLSILNNSLKQIASSKVGSLRTLSVTLNSITTDLSNISASATQILKVTSNSLHSIFGRLLDSTSKLSNFGDLVSSLSKLIITISTALHALLFAVNDYTGSPCYANDAIREITKTVQILISTFAATIRSSANSNSDILEKVAVEVASLPYLVLTIMLVIQQVLGAAIPSVSAVTGSITSTHLNLTFSLSSILDSLASITTAVTVLLTDGSLEEIASKILTSVSSLQDSTSESLSKISGVAANIQVTVGLSNQAPES